LDFILVGGRNAIFETPSSVNRPEMMAEPSTWARYGQIASETLQKVT
jgi:hypothetical protein